METETVIWAFYILVTLIPIHVGTFLGIRAQNKKRRQLLWSIWKMQNRLKFRR